MAKRVSLTGLWLLIGVLSLTACALPTAADEIAAGSKVYTQNCAICHQPDGEGYEQVFPHLAGNPIVTLHNPEPVIEIVLNGRGSMPSFRHQLSIAERAQVISYIRTAWGNDASTVSRPQVK